MKTVRAEQSAIARPSTQAVIGGSLILAGDLIETRICCLGKLLTFGNT